MALNVSINNSYDGCVDDHTADDDDRTPTDPQNEVVPELFLSGFLILLGFDAVCPDLAAHLQELAIAIHRTIATFKVGKRAVQKLVANVFLHLHQLVLSLKDVKRLLSVVGEVKLLEKFRLFGLVLFLLDDLL